MDNPNQENHFEPYNPQQYQQYPPQPPINAYDGNNSFATASLVMGILALVSMCCAPPLTFVLGGLGMIFSCLSKGKYSRSGSAKAGMALSAGCTGIVTAFFLIILIVFTSTEKGNAFLNDYLNLLLSGDEVTSEEIYDFMDKYLNGDGSSDDYNDNDGRTYPDWDDRFGNYYFYDQEPDSPGWNDTPYYDTDPGTSEVPGGEFI